MKIGVIDSRPRTRTFKELYMLQNIHECFFFGASDNKQNMQLLPNVEYHRVNNHKQVMDICRKKKIDILHTHNFPDIYGKWGLNIRDKLGIPVVHEIHDMSYENSSISNKQLEQYVVPKADAIITVGQGMHNEILRKYNRNSTIIYAMPNKDLLPKPYPKNDKFVRGIYQGGIRRKEDKKSKFNHRYYDKIFKKLVSQGLRIDVMPTYSMNNSKKINGVKFRNFEPDMKKLYRRISAYDFEFVGYNQTRSGVMDIAMPNKLFEAIACGVPVVAMNYDNIGSYVRNNLAGIVVDKNNLKIPPDFDKQMATCKKHIMQHQNSFVMESQLKKLTKLYKRVIMS